MMEYEELSSQEREEIEGNMALMDKTIFEYLYFLLNQIEAPYDGYNADGVLSPKEDAHDIYFVVYKVNAIKLFNDWKPKLEALGGDEVFVFLERVDTCLSSSTDMVELTWAATQLYKMVSIYLEKQKVA